MRIIDSASDRAQESRAIGIQARTLEVFEISGIIDEFLELGHRLNGVTLYGKTGSENGHLDFAYVPSRYPFLLTLLQSETEGILGDSLLRNGLQIEPRTTLIGFEQSDFAVLAKIALPDGRQEETLIHYSGHQPIASVSSLCFNSVLTEVNEIAGQPGRQLTSEVH